MFESRQINRRFLLALVVAASVVVSGCATTGQYAKRTAMRRGTENVPRELCKVTLPDYVIEPPDILTIEAVNIQPKPPYQLHTGDAVAVQVQNTLPDAPIEGTFRIEPGGMIRLGPPYGALAVGGMTVEEATRAIDQHLRKDLREPIVHMALADTVEKQQIAGEHLVAPDGSVNLGTYGSVRVVGQTVPQAKAAIEAHLSQFLDQPEVSVEIFAYNSKKYYLFIEGGGMGDQLYTFPITGNETVLDAISQINGLSAAASKRIWISRPSPVDDVAQILPVDWRAITVEGAANTNYQILPGDRIFVAEDPLVGFDTRIGKIIAPFERMFGFSILGAETATRFSGKVLRGGGNPRGTGGGVF